MTLAKSETLDKVNADGELLPRAMKEAIRRNNGNLPAAAEELGVKVSRLDRAVRLSRECLKFVGKLKTDDINDKWLTYSRHAIEEDIERRAVLYRSEALDELRAIALMPISDNSANNQVKLAAALRLTQQVEDKVVVNEMDALLRTINDDFKKNAPRLRTIRQTVREVTFEGEAPIAIESVATRED